MTENEYLPYKSINVFINRDYLESAVRLVLQEYRQLPQEKARPFIKQFREHVNILGFRNTIKAPLSLQINAFASAFEEKNEVVPFTLSTWANIKSDLAVEVESWLKSEGWKGLTVDREFNDAEGFLSNWPKKLTFKKLIKDFKKAKPDVEFDQDDLILMVIWISGKLPPDESEL